MMLYPAMRDLLKIPSRYQMVNMVAHRASGDLRRGGDGRGAPGR